MCASKFFHRKYFVLTLTGWGCPSRALYYLKVEGLRLFSGCIFFKVMSEYSCYINNLHEKNCNIHYKNLKMFGFALRSKTEDKLFSSNNLEFQSFSVRCSKKQHTNICCVYNFDCQSCPFQNPWKCNTSP